MPRLLPRRSAQHPESIPGRRNIVNKCNAIRGPPIEEIPPFPYAHGTVLVLRQGEFTAPFPKKMKTTPLDSSDRTTASASRSLRLVRKASLPAATAALLFFASLTPAHAANVNLTTSNTTSGQTGFTTASFWSNNQAPSLANDYFVNTNFILRTPGTGPGPFTFGGNSLTVNGGGLGFSTLGGSNTTINNFTLTGSGYLFSTQNATQTLSGTLAITGTTFARLNAADTTVRNITIDSTISGTGSLQVLQTGTVSLTGAGNTFSGTWKVGGDATVGGTAYTNTSLRVSTLDASSAGSLGINSSLAASSYSIIRIGYDWNTTGSLTLNENSTLFLDHNLTVGSLSISGTALAEGEYSYAFLSTTYAGFFNTTGSGGSITVGAIPEPSSFAALAGGTVLFGCSFFRRRRHS